MTDKKLSQLSAGTAITPADLFYSAQGVGSQVKQTAEALKSFMFPGFIDAMDPAYGIVTGLGQSSGQRTTNGTGLNAASAAAGVAGKLLLLPPALIEYSATATDGGINVGFQLDYRAQGLIGWGSSLTRLVQYASNHPVLTLGTVSNAANIMQHATIRGIGVGTGVSQAANTSGHGIVIGNIAWCVLEDLFVDPFIAGGARTDVYIGMINPGVNSIGQFENWFNNITIKSGAFEFLELSGNSTGSTWGPVYIGDSSNFFVDWRTPSGNAVVFNNQTSIGTFLELNLEWIQSPSGVTSGLLLFNNCRGGSFDQIRIEGTRLTGADPNMIGATLSNITVQSLNLYSCTIASGDVSGTPKILGIFEDSHFSVDNGNWQWNVFANGTGAATASFYLFGQAGVSGQNRGRIEFRNIYMVGNAAGTFNFDSGLPNSVTGNVYEFGRYNYNPGISRVEDPKIIIDTFASTYDLYGWAIRPEIVVNAVLTAAMTITWKDTWGAAGIGNALPATSPDILMLTRSASATGAFNLLLKNSGGSTITTQGSASTTNNITRNGTTLTNF